MILHTHKGTGAGVSDIGRLMLPARVSAVAAAASCCAARSECKIHFAARVEYSVDIPGRGEDMRAKTQSLSEVKEGERAATPSGVSHTPASHTHLPHTHTCASP